MSKDRLTEDNPTLVQLRNGSSRGFTCVADAMLWCWDVGTDKVDTLTIGDNKPIEIWEIFKRG